MFLFQLLVVKSCLDTDTSVDEPNANSEEEALPEGDVVEPAKARHDAVPDDHEDDGTKEQIKEENENDSKCVTEIHNSIYLEELNLIDIALS